MKNLLQVLLVYFGLVACLYAQSPTLATPNLTISAGSSVASGLVINSDSPRAWKRFAVTAASSGGTWSIVSAEHGTGDDGGIYFYTLTATAGTASAPGPFTPPPAPDTLPIATLTGSLSTATAGIDAASLTAMAQGYDAVAQQIDAGAITSPTQLYLVTGVQILSLTADQRTAVQPVTTAVAAWLNAQQVAGKLDETKMPDYSRVLHAIAKALRPATPAAAKPKAKVEESPKLAPPQPVGNSPCANGQCPASAAPTYRFRWGR